MDLQQIFAERIGQRRECGVDGAAGSELRQESRIASIGSDGSGTSTVRDGSIDG